VETRLANGRDLSFEYRIVLPDGAMRWIHTVGEHRPDASGPGRRVFGINIDVTDRKGAEAALKHAAREQQALTHRLQEVREDERTLLARELHDEVGQNLTVARMDLSVLESIPPEDRPAAKWQFERLQATMDHSLDLIRDMAVRMRPPVLDVLGLSAAVEAYIGDFTDRFGSLACQLDLANAPEDVAGDVAIAAYRIVQEALTNVASHSEATEVTVSLRGENGWLTVRVDDNGIGIAPDAPHSLSALGLLGMRERAEALSGQLAITPGAHGGTRVQADLPLGPAGSPSADPRS